MILHLVIRVAGWRPEVVYASTDEAKADRALARLRATCRHGDGVSYVPDVVPAECDELLDVLVRDARERVA